MYMNFIYIMFRNNDELLILFCIMPFKFVVGRVIYEVVQCYPQTRILALNKCTPKCYLNFYALK